ncbi:radical SAM protein [uncultured Acinetobacter sp.]|uniref:B12-binding domain-containing radical SAM protein n=1 Tax=uncultured Acinetobacter sp. TaxID=165433 RepID=UPI002590B887|nr:radical SAM protein [uncultured Acinetobacter sp.]
MSLNYFFCISAGQTITRKQKTPFSLKHRYLNYGLLSLATLLKEQGINTIQIQGLFDQPIKTLYTCINDYDLLKTQYPIFLSIPSFYALEWASEFINLIYKYKPQQKIVIGGRWVIGNSITEIKKVLPPVDQIITGTGEYILPSILAKYNLFFIKSNNKHFSLDYSLLHDRHLYQPSIEISRGCGKGCSFCQEKDEKLTPLKPVSHIINELKNTLVKDNFIQMTPYFETSMFTPNTQWSEQLKNAMLENNLFTQWRTEARVDSISTKNIPYLAEAGLKVIDLGLESASKTQLIAMHKTKEPNLYLERASNLLKVAHQHGIKTKVNILLFAGETQETLKQSEDWLENHRQYITGVSVGPVTVYGWEQENNLYIKKLKEMGASISHSSIGIKHLNLSKEIDFETSQILSRKISQSFMKKEQYFYLKSFSYLPRDYNYENFLIDLESVSNIDKLSFSL